MNAVAEIGRQAITDLVVNNVLSATVVFAPGGVDDILKKLADEVRAIKTDISTPTGRKAVASLAHKIARSKTALDKLGKDLGETHYKSWKAITAERTRIETTLDALKDEVRKPLTDWENAEDDRVKGHEIALAELQGFAVFTSEPTVEKIDSLLCILEKHPPRDWQEFSARAAEATVDVIAKLTAKRAEIVQRETERAELERLRREKAEQEQRARDAKIAAEAAARAKAEAEAKASREADEAARKAEQEKQKVEREKAAAIARAEKAEADKKAAAARAEREKQEAVEAERRRVATAKAAEDAEIARREANKKHVAKINKEVADALVGAADLDARQAMGVVAAILRGDVPHTTISY